MKPQSLLATKLPPDLQGWDPTRIKKGSRIIPFMLLLLVGIVFATTQLPAGRDLIADHVKRSCEIMRGKAASPATTDRTTQPATLTADQASTAKTRVHPFVTKCEQAADKQAVETLADQLKAGPTKGLIDASNNLPANLIGTKELARGFAASVKYFFDHVVRAAREHATDGLSTIALAALFSVVPGIAGAIYRRAFWTWFAVSFIAVLAISSIGNSLAQLNKEKLDPTGINEVAGGLFVLVVSQIVVLLLSHRLRRQSSTASLMASALPERIANTLLAAALWAAAIAIGWFDYGTWLWDYIPGSATFNKWNFILLGLPLIYTLFKVKQSWTGTAQKNIVVCLDGTNNTPDQMEFGQVAHTNVFKLFRSLKADQPPRADDAFDAHIVKRYKDRQIGFYYIGVGSSFDNSGIGQTLGQATGLGASGLVDRAYLDVMKVYRPGDKIYIFGFSRGAAISRLLARAINQRGAPRSAWTLRLFGRHWTLWKSKPAAGSTGSVPIAVLGCWDTVGAFGLAKKVAGIDFQKVDLFKDLSVPDNVEQAYHLVAIDERRDSFVPTLMEPDPLNESRIVEVWFSGDHANVGGGWATPKLSDVTLDFMLRQVSSGYAHSFDPTKADDPKQWPGYEEWGLYLSAFNGQTFPAEHPARSGAVELDPDILGQQRQWMSGLYDYTARALPLHAVISDTVFQRMTRSEPVYAPQSLFDLNDELDKKRGAVGKAVDQLKGTKSIKDDEYDRVMAYKDRMQLTRWSQHIDELKRRGREPDPASALLLK